MMSCRKRKNTPTGTVSLVAGRWLECRTHDWKVAGSNPCWSGGRIFFSRVNFLCWLLFQYPFHPCVTTVARKRPWSFCQKRRWQVTAKHAYTLRMWLCLKWHGAWLYGVHRMRRDGCSFMRHQPYIKAINNCYLLRRLLWCGMVQFLVQSNYHMSIYLLFK